MTIYGHDFQVEEPIPAGLEGGKHFDSRYELTWEQVRPEARHKYCDADPNRFLGAQQIKPNSAVEEKDWHRMDRVVCTGHDSDEDLRNILHHARTLKLLDGKENGMVRNVSLKKYVTFVREVSLNG